MDNKKSLITFTPVNFQAKATKKLYEGMILLECKPNKKENIYTGTLIDKRDPDHVRTFQGELKIVGNLDSVQNYELIKGVLNVGMDSNFTGLFNEFLDIGYYTSYQGHFKNNMLSDENGVILAKYPNTFYKYKGGTDENGQYGDGVLDFSGTSYGLFGTFTEKGKWGDNGIEEVYDVYYTDMNNKVFDVEYDKESKEDFLFKKLGKERVFDIDDLMKELEEIPSKNEQSKKGKIAYNNSNKKPDLMIKKEVIKNNSLTSTANFTLSNITDINPSITKEYTTTIKEKIEEEEKENIFETLDNFTIKTDSDNLTIKTKSSNLTIKTNSTGGNNRSDKSIFDEKFVIKINDQQGIKFSTNKNLIKDDAMRGVIKDHLRNMMNNGTTPSNFDNVGVNGQI